MTDDKSLEIAMLRNQIEKLERAIDTKRITLYGNTNPGLTTKVATIEKDLTELRNDIKILYAYRDRWTETTNPGEYLALKKKIQSFDPHDYAEYKKKVDLLIEHKWYILGGVTLLNILLIVFGQSLISKL